MSPQYVQDGLSPAFSSLQEHERDRTASTYSSALPRPGAWQPTGQGQCSPRTPRRCLPGQNWNKLTCHLPWVKQI